MLLSVSLYPLMQDMGFNFIKLPFKEYKASGTLNGNILTIVPRECIMINGFPDTRNALESAGIKLKVFNGDALCIGCEGGPTCLLLLPKGVISFCRTIDRAETIVKNIHMLKCFCLYVR